MSDQDDSELDVDELDDLDDDLDNGGEAERERPEPKNPPRSRESLHRENAKYRVQRNAARSERDTAIRERDEARAEAEALKASGGTQSGWGDRLMQAALVEAVGDSAHDLSAVAKLIDPARVSIEADGTVRGVDREVERLRNESPFLWKPDDDSASSTGHGERNPFDPPRRTGRPINRANKGSKSGATTAQLKSKYPALR